MSKFIDNNPNRKVYNIDVDGTLTNNASYHDEEPEPNWSMVDKVRKTYEDGNVIIIHTARRWEHAHLLVAWLIKHMIPFHGIYMGKGGSDCYVDDKSVDPYTFCLRQRPKSVQEAVKGLRIPAHWDPNL